MAVAFPYSRYACPCSDLVGAPTATAAEDEGDDETFNPHAPRAAYSLHPLEQLLYCDECNAPRCLRCCSEEMMCWYCPNCMFEVPSSGVKADGNRCARQCYDCPVCHANLAVTVADASKNRSAQPHLKPEDAAAAASESYFLLCQYCHWSSLDIGVRFSKPTKVTEQLSRLWKSRIAQSAEQHDQQPGPQHDAAFANLTRFYKDQMSESSDQANLYSNSPYSSPANLARIMSLYGGLSHNSLKKSREKPQPMREAGNHAEGISTFTAESDNADDDAIDRMRRLGLKSTSTQSQRLQSPYNFDARLMEHNWPIATKLRVRRGKRCRTCRQFLVRPETKPDRLRYKIRLLASQHIPRLLARPLSSTGPTPNPAFRIRTEAVDEVRLQPYQTLQYVLTVRNPIFETVKISLATPATTPGRIQSKVTILCPSFNVGPSGDMWDEALSHSTTSEGGRQAAMASLTGAPDGDRQPEAGKIWERTRNTTSVILEVVPGGLQRRPSIVSTSDDGQEGELAEDEDILEIPVYIRAEWEADASGHEALHHEEKAKTSERVTKELAYWCVLGLGRIMVSR
ncbi:hypothetical protein CKM354_000257500 [Cercospora kikuchii]|uniref:Dynactin subunit 4 n=1 Tax=Cercospora kikuchii TaxID=84275 RepID=A0A9P3CA59_9PEZI|nr:uncharacterized protein CKM354_000257500 [Cercospora kikuchii]GIZ39184.1 hypothetical protein CKM354_000257500 [Cercospora kikuchii]